MPNAFDLWRDSFNKVGWFIPPFIQMGFLSEIVAEIHVKGNGFKLDDLEQKLSIAYCSTSLANMVVNRYPKIPFIKDYKDTIAEAVEAHFLGLDHIAVGGLVPVIEGAGRRLADDRGLASEGSIKNVFKLLATDCKRDSAENNIGAVDEIASMMESFMNFAEIYFYSSSQSYPLPDNTNRHGIAHGVYTDADYGRPINFYKTIAGIDFLTFIAGFRVNISIFAPDPTETSIRRAGYYEYLRKIRNAKPQN